MLSAVPTSNKLFHHRNEDNRNIVNTQYLAKKIFGLIWNAIGLTEFRKKNCKFDVAMIMPVKFWILRPYEGNSL